VSRDPATLPRTPLPATTDGTEYATFGEGCFWCTEAVFQQVKGVVQVTSGYAGGWVEHPTYRQVCGEGTGHAEALLIRFDPKSVTYDQLLEMFWGSHDPTTKDRQGADEGPSYRSVIFFHSEEQRKAAEGWKAKLNQAGAFPAPIVTEIVPFSNFYPAEDYHQDYFELNGSAPYCELVIRPKFEKFRKVFASRLK